MPLGQWTVLTSEEVEQIRLARQHDESFGPSLPDHYQAQWDRRNLLAIIEKLQRGR